MDGDTVHALHVCIACGRTFKNHYKLNDHIRQAGEYHNNKCPRCPGVEFKSWPEHQQHQKTAHKGVIFLTCKFCPEVFEEKKMRLDHVKKVHNQRVQHEQCTECGKLVVKGCLKAHQETHTHLATTDPVQCTECSKWFQNKRKYWMHYKVHRKYCCELCGMTISLSHKKSHDLRNHTPEDKKPFRCPICIPVKGFISQLELDEHVNIHNGVKPYACDLCPNAAYSNKANLYAHVRTTHQGKKRK